MKNLTKTQKTFAGIGILLLVVLLLACAVVDVWWLYVELYAPDKYVSTQMNFSELTTDDGDKAIIWEINYMSNANKNGLECLEIKSTYFKDENKDDFFSQGLQYIAKSKDEGLDWYDEEDLKGIIDVYAGKSTFINVGTYIREKIGNDYSLTSYKVFKDGWWIFGTDYYANYFSPFITNGEKYNYQSYDNYATFGSTNPLTTNSSMLIETGDNPDTEENESIPYYARFKGDNYAEFISIKDFKADTEKISQLGSENFYWNYNEDYFAYQIYKAVKGASAGQEGEFVYEFADCFKYFDQKTNEELSNNDTSKVTRDIKNYYKIKVKVSADGARNANDSMFGALHGTANYVVGGDTIDSGNYFAGKTIIDCDVYDFEFVKVTGNKVALKLKNSFIQEHIKYVDDIALRIILDYDVFSVENVEYIGFTADSGLENFEIMEIKTINAEVTV